MASTISAELKVVGELTSDGDIEIDGRVEGKVNGRAVTVGPRGHVNGAILAESVRIKGAIEGEIGAMSVALEASAVVKANITYRSLSVDGGAFFVGNVHGTASKEPSG
jgi:cytoskeletal protein CcmA (bactofilin family)